MALARILVVDDDAKALGLFDAILKKEGYEIFKVATAEAAIEEAKGSTPDLILMDVVLPDMNGAEAAKVLNEDPGTKDIPIIFFTGMITKEEEQIGQAKVNIDGRNYETIAKPFAQQELLDKVSEALSQRGL